MSISAVSSGVVTESEWEGRGWFPPGPQLAICLSGEQRLVDRSDAELIEIMAAARRQTAWAQARELAAIAELTARRQAEDDSEVDQRVLSASESLIEEIATALTITGNAAATLMHTAQRLARSLPGTRAALEKGHIDLPKARVICDATEGVPDDTAAVLETAVLERASRQTTGQLRRRTKTLVRRLAPEAFDDHARQTVRHRRVEVWEDGSGTASLALLDIAADDAQAIHNKLTAAARAVRADGDSRTLDQIRADLAARLLRGHPLSEAVTHLLNQPPVAARDTRSSADVGQTPSTEGSEALPLPRQGDLHKVSSLAADVQQQLDEVKARLRAAGRLSELPQQVERTVRGLHQALTPFRNAHCASDSQGLHGHPGYRPPAELRRMVQARHPVCVFPTCNQRTEHCDLDHTVAYDQHGPTCGCNLAPLCRRHHRLKQTRDWHLYQPWPGLLVWITPSGTWHIVRPE